MGIELARAYITIRADSKQMVLHFRRARQGSEAELSKLSTFVQGTFAAGVIAGISRIGKEIFKVTAQFERMEMSMRVMLGESKEAQAVFQRLREFAAETPFEFEEVFNAALILKAAKIPTEVLEPMLTRLGDVASIARTDLESLATLMAKVRVGETMRGRELYQFVTRSVPLIEELEEITGKTWKTLRKEMLAGAGPSFEQVMLAIDRLTREGGVYFNATALLASTLSGELNKVTDQWTLLKVEMGETMKVVAGPVLRALKSVLSTIREFLDTAGPVGRFLFGLAFSVAIVGVAVLAVVRAVNALITALATLEIAGTAFNAKTVAKWAAIIATAAGVAAMLEKATMGPFGEHLTPEELLEGKLKGDKAYQDILKRGMALSSLTAGEARGGGRFGLEQFGQHLQDLLLQTDDKQGQMVALLEAGNVKQDMQTQALREINKNVQAMQSSGTLE